MIFLNINMHIYYIYTYTCTYICIYMCAYISMCVYIYIALFSFAFILYLFSLPFCVCVCILCFLHHWWHMIPTLSTLHFSPNSASWRVSLSVNRGLSHCFSQLHWDLSAAPSWWAFEVFVVLCSIFITPCLIFICICVYFLYLLNFFILFRFISCKQYGIGFDFINKSTEKSFSFSGWVELTCIYWWDWYLCF